MNCTNPLKTAAAIAIALAIGVFMIACSSQTASKSTSGSAESSDSAAKTTASGSKTADASTSDSTGSSGNEAKTIACIGDSITYGHGLENPSEQSWPALLQAKLGDAWHVVNLGVSGTTLIDEGGYPYRSTGNVEQAKQLGADLYIIMLGTNDANDSRFDIESYRTQLAALVDELAASALQGEQPAEEGDSSAQPQFVLMAPPRTFYYLANDAGADELNRIIGEDIRNVVQSVAAEKGARYLDLYALTEQHPEWFPDYLHPNAEGARAIADYIYESMR